MNFPDAPNTLLTSHLIPCDHMTPCNLHIFKMLICLHMTDIEYRDKFFGQLCAMQNRATMEALMLSNLLTDAVLVVY